MLKRFYSISEVADILDVSISTIRRILNSKRLRAHRIGRQLKIDRADLEGFIDRAGK